MNQINGIFYNIIPSILQERSNDQDTQTLASHMNEMQILNYKRLSSLEIQQQPVT